MKLSLNEIKTIASQMATIEKLSSGDYEITRNNVLGMVDKIGKQIYNDSIYTSKLAFMDGEGLPYGKDIEEWSTDLILPQDFDENGDDALALHKITTRPPFYSKSLGRKKIPVSIQNNNFNRACLGASEFAEVTTSIVKKLNDSRETMKYALKRQILGSLIGNVKGEAYSGATYTQNNKYDVGTYLKDSSGNAYVVVKALKVGDNKILQTAVDEGYLIKLEILTTIAKPVDTPTGEEFIKQVKKDVEVGQDVSEGYSLNGNTLGVSPVGYKLLIKQGILPSLEVDTLAGAFNLDKLALPVEIEVVKDFGDHDTLPNAYAMLIDKRGARLHPTYMATRSQENASGDFTNIFDHSEWTGYVSRNTFLKIYTE